METNSANPVSNDLAAVVTALNKHHVTISASYIAFLILFVVLCGFMYLHTVQSYERLLGQAEAHEQIYEKSMQTLQKQIQSDDDAIKQLAKEKAQVETKVVYRDKTADAAVQAALTPNLSEQQVSDDVVKTYNFAPVSMASGYLGFNVPETQQFVATKIDRDRLSADLTDSKTELGIETQDATICKTDLSKTQNLLGQAQGTIDAYKKAAKKSKWHRVMDGIEKFALFVGGAYIGKKL